MEKYILVEYLNTFNAVISQTFKSAKRIKLTSFDVSSNYVIFGASSGGIYIFKRNSFSCEFSKLIPSKEGSVLKTSISPNEKDIALVSSKGVVIIIENFVDSNFKFFVHNYHEGNVVTEIIWNKNNIYFGDNTGKISVFSSSNLLNIFHTSSAVLMQLDSSVVQIDVYLNYLLISTLTRTYLCDTEKEQYKQVGKKLRDGCFGGCFFNANSNEDLIETNHSFKGIFRTVTEEEHFCTCLANTDTKIYCGRPGARIWEVNFEAKVLRTYQFKESLGQPPADILQIADLPDQKLTITVSKGSDELSRFNFGKIYPIRNEFVFTYNIEGIYFFNLKTSSLMGWVGNFDRIRDVKIFNSVVYVWEENLKITVIGLESLDNLIVKTLLNKQYYLCAELCVKFMEDVRSLLDSSKSVHLISILKFKLNEIGASNLLEELNPILCKLEEYKTDSITYKKLKNGIVLVDNVYRNSNLECDFIPESVQDFQDCELNQNDENRDTSDTNSQSDTEDSTLLALYRQYQLNKTHRTAELTESSTILEEKALDSLLVLLTDFVKFVETLDKTDATKWCKEQFLKQASKKITDVDVLKEETLKYLSETFLEINQCESICKCKFPLPKAHKYPIDYYRLGCKISDKLRDPDYGLSQVPYLYKFKLSRIDNPDDLLLNLPLLIQFGDRSLIERLFSMFTYDTWDEIVKVFIKLKRGVCVNCSEPVDSEGIWSWTNLGVLMIKSIGPDNTCRLLKRYSKYIPEGALDQKFYQCCIFSATFQEPQLAVNFMEEVVSESTSQTFEDLMEKYLHRKYLGYQPVTIKCDVTVEVPRCVSCKLPLNEPVINEIKKCDRGHTFHSLCLTSNNGICTACTST